MDCSPSGFSAHRILEARIPEWVVISFSRGSSQPRNQTQDLCIAGRFFINWAVKENPMTRYIGYEKHRHCFADKGPSSQSYGFSSRHVWMWELGQKESWVPKNWCFLTVILEKTLESPLDCKEIESVNPKGNQSSIFTGRTDAEALILWPPDAKSRLIRTDLDVGKDWRQEDMGKAEDQIFGWYHWLNGHEFEQVSRYGEAQGSLACCSPWVSRSRTRPSDWTTTYEKKLYSIFTFLGGCIVFKTSINLTFLFYHLGFLLPYNFLFRIYVHWCDGGVIKSPAIIASLSISPFVSFM